MLVQDVLRGTLGARVTPWTRVADLWSRLDGDLNRAGAYLLGLFDALPDVVSLANDDGEVIYIGETHGPDTNLRVRLWSLAYTIGLVETGHWAHVAGNAFNRRFDGEEAWARATARLAIAPLPFDMTRELAPDMRGVVPLLMEKQLLAAYVRVHGVLPALNDYERVMPAEWQASPDAAVLTEAMSQPLTEERGRPLAAWVAQACAWKGRPSTATWKPDGSWKGWEFIPRRGWRVYLGRTDADDHLSWSVWAKEDGAWREVEAPRMIRTTRDASAAAFAFQYGWRTQFSHAAFW